MKGFRRVWWLGWALALALAWLGAGCQGSPAAAPSATRPVMTPTPAPSRVTPTQPPPTSTPSITPTPSATATATATATPTPIPTPTPPPGGVAATDAIEDGIYCSTGKRARFVLPPEVDLYHAAVTVETTEEGECVYHFVILFAQPIGENGFAGGVEIYHPDHPLREPPSRTWFFDNLGYLSLNFRWVPDAQRLKTWVTGVRFGRWQDLALPDYRAWVDEQGRLHLTVPCDALPPGATWVVAATDPYNTKCDVLGLGEENLPALPLPTLPAEFQALTPTAPAP